MTLAIIGGGPAGYAAAVTAARRGAEVVLIDKGPLGGTCLNEGCIPTKSLLESANVLDKIRHANTFGIELPQNITLNWARMQGRKRQIVNRLVQGIQYLMKANQIKVISGTASFLSDQTLLIEGEGGEKEILEADRILIASGSEPAELPFAPFDGDWVIDSKDVLSLQQIPSSLLIVGGGVIGCEFASLFSRFKTKVTMIESADRLLPAEDEDIAAAFEDSLRDSGVDIQTKASFQRIDRERKTAVWTKDGKEIETQADHILVAIGRKPRLQGLNLEQAGILYSPRGIEVNDHMQTNIAHIYACGDAAGGMQLAHAAIHEGITAASHATGKDSKANMRAVPRCIYTSPEMAAVGLTETQAREKYGEVKIGECSFSANGKALIKHQHGGKMKIIAEPEFGEIVGVSMIGPDVTELIGQAVMLMNGEMTADMSEHFIAAHPTLSETLQEALLNVTGLAVHSV
ncbi:dihydrolipoyl dehydrogenase [Bacillus amyloliquefaciens]|uniref:dihydrolipoyl dehydrogenase n=1 Tax=Bacillus amyloliquefaciens TaxID=1390 RepID=UPI000E263170|nr:dihydrolipoyl dehydrogenase [Bacillus amyloliquefaciens]RDY85492.1 dihydrolipoyl dehydrogenase [Bacillus amyloliquefaciens]